MHYNLVSHHSTAPLLRGPYAACSYSREVTAERKGKGTHAGANRDRTGRTINIFANKTQKTVQMNI